MKILITEFMDQRSVENLMKKYDVIYDTTLASDQDRIPALIYNIDAIIVRNRTQVTKELIDKSLKLSCIGRLGVGLDNIDIKSCEEKNISVYPALGANTNSVVEYVLTTSMLLLRGAYQKQSEMIDGSWPRDKSSGNEISGKKLGLIGFGEIAQKTSFLAKSFGMTVCAFDPYKKSDDPAWENVQKIDLENLLKTSDVISIHTPLNDSTYHLLDAKRLKMLKTSAVLINAARGGIIDEKALSEILHKGKIRGAALDVFENEPLSKLDGNLFKGLKNIIITPHIAGVTLESNERVSAMIADCIDTHLSSVQK